jgi:short-subunit dehydrogenase
MKANNTIALITGASGGIGEAFAIEHAKRGGHVALVARNEQKLNALAADLQKTYQVAAYVLPLDLLSEGAAAKVFSWTQDLNLQVDILINNAGFGELGPFLESDLQTHTEMMALNMQVLVQLTYHYGKLMAGRKAGRILQVASVAAFLPGPGMSVYYATKAFVLNFSEGLAEELRNAGVTVTTLCPGPTASGFQERANMDMKQIMMGLFAKMPTSTAVAAYGYIGMMKGRRVLVHGFANRMMLWSAQILPISWKARMMHRFQLN